MTTISLREQLQSTLHNFGHGSLKENALALLEQLGYSSDKQIDLEPNTVATFKENFGDAPEHITFNDDKALVDQWLSVDFLFQLAGDDLAIAGQLPLMRSRAVDTSAEAWQSYLFFAIHLRERERPYTRTELANITREVNKLFLMPAMVIFQHGQKITLSVINRRLNKRYPERDVLEKVTLIKDINIAHTHRAHLEILADLSSDELYRVHGFTTFEELHQAWQKTLDSSELNKRFFQEVANWYFWAIAQVEFPAGIDGRNSNEMSVIRLITRLIFVWFLKEKGLVSDRLFNPNPLRTILKTLDDDENTYYWAILQNLFFATLNQEPDKRQFCDNTKHRKGYNRNRLSTNLYRHQELFQAEDEAEILGLFRDIPFLNGGLFECLDEEVTRDGKRVVQRVDGFSRNPKEAAKVPNILFFQEEPLTIDLNATYDTKGKRYSVRGLLHILNSYKFTVTENTPIEEEIALDPELLGKVFENLLAAYNPETQTTARKKTGSFYTPREVVDYMVDESLVTYFENALQKIQPPRVAQASSLGRDPECRQDACATFFSPDDEVTITQRNLPHWRQQGSTYFVTFRLADSIPQHKLAQLRDERENWQKHHQEPYSDAEKAEYHRLFSQRVQDWMDAGMGACHLRDPELAQIVADALKYFDGDRYTLDEWVVMPNHVHVLVTPHPGHDLSKILHSWKSYTATQINRRLQRQGALWQEESYNHIVRSPQQLQRIRQYIVNNPAQAGIEVTQTSRLAQPRVAQASSLGDPEPRQDAWATLREKLGQLLDYRHQENPFADDPEITILLIKAINELRALDPAVGSGAFPMGMLQKLVMILSKLDPDNAIWKLEQRERMIGEEERKIRQDVAIAKQISHEEVRQQAIRGLEEQLARLEAEFAEQDMDYTRKLFLIENCLYGVDIQNIAVQIAKLRCFIALIVEQRVDDSKENRGIFPLPNLEMKFVAANTLFALEKAEQLSLLGGDIELKEKETELEKLRHEYFQTYDLSKKRRLKEKDEALRGEIATLLQTQNVSKSSAEKIAYWKPYDQLAQADFFDPHWMFGIDDGFDIVIGNPPYVRQEQIKDIKPQLKPLYNCYTGVADLYVYFFERALQLLKPGGVLTYICSNKYFRANYGEKLRNVLSQKTRIHTLIDFGDAPVFTAIAYPSIIVTQQSQPNGNAIAAMNWDTDRPVEEFVEVFDTHKFDLAQTYLGKDGWQLESPAVFNLLAKLRAAGTPLGEYVNGRFYRGIVTGYNQAFVVDRTTRDALIAADPASAEVLKPFVRGRDVKRWRVNFADQYLIKIESSENKIHPWSKKKKGKGFLSPEEAEEVFSETYPAIYDYFSQFRKQLIKRCDQGRHFWELRSCIYWKDFKQPKIIYPDIYEHQSFSVDLQGLFSGNTCYFIPTTKIWLCGLLNSSITEWFYANISNSVRGGYLRAFSDYMKQIPIPPASDADKAAITTLVQKCLDAKGQNVAQWEAEIDDRVAHLYGLTPEDLKIIQK